MFNTSRKKIVLSILAITILFFLATLTAIYTTSYLSLKKQSKEMLGKYVDSFTLENDALEEFPKDAPGRVPQGDGETHLADGVLYQVSSFILLPFPKIRRSLLLIQAGAKRILKRRLSNLHRKFF
jgi:hypothetical protein